MPNLLNGVSPVLKLEQTSTSMAEIQVENANNNKSM
jgi:hypothetical protein